MRAKGLEPIRLAAHEPKSCASANFATPAYSGGYRPTPAFVTFKVIRVITYQLLWLIFTRNYIAKTSVGLQVDEFSYQQRPRVYIEIPRAGSFH